MKSCNMYIAASAGSGKTYQLVNRFISLLCIQHLNGQAVDVSRLMAITFTRKAAGEFKSRILASLAQAAGSPQAAQTFWTERVDPTLSQFNPDYTRPTEPQALFLTILQAVMAQFSQLQLSTIDSLLERMMRGMSPELGISAISIIDPLEEELYKRKALNASYLSHQSEEDLNHLADNFNESQSSEASLSSPDRSLLRLVQENHSNYIKSPQALWGGQPEEMSDDQLAAFGLSRANIIPCQSPEEYEEAIQILQNLAEKPDIHFPEPLPTPDDKNLCSVGNHPQLIAIAPSSRRHYRKPFLKMIESLRYTGGELALPKATKFIINPTLWSLEHEYYPAYWDICRRAGADINDILQTKYSFQWQQILTRTHAIAQIIQQFESCYDEEVRQTGSLGFADIANLIQQHAGELSLDKLQERIDMSIEHWMLDEFQDTSHQQYHILLNLLQSRAQGGDDGSVFMVGDAKQSIYQFRGGDPEIFLHARTLLVGDEEEGASTQTMSLNKSYRSASEVLDLVNMLFEDASFPRLAAKSRAGSLAQWSRFRYEKHLSGRPELKGCAEIWETRDKAFNIALSNSVQDVSMLHSIAAKLAQIRPKGCAKALSCAILVSTRKQGNLIQDFLLEHQEEYGIEGPILLNAKKKVGEDSVLGLALIHFFRWLNTAGDKRSLSLLQISPLWQRIESLGGQEAWSKLRELWSNKGCAATLQELFSGSGEQLISNAFLRQRKKIWVESAAQFDRLGGHLSEWISHISALEQSEESQGNEITIMTIHQSKGLEFDAVFIPIFESNDPFIDLTKIKLISTKDEEGKELSVLLRPPKSLIQAFPDFEQHMMEHQYINEEVGGYCKLYVAMTRAKLATYIMLPPAPKTQSSSTRESFKTLLRALSEELPAPSKDEMLFHSDKESQIAQCTLRLGDSKWYEAYREGNASPDAAPAPALEPLDYHFTSLPRSTPSGLDRDRQQDAREITSTKVYPLSEQRGAAFGSLVHGLFEQISWLDQELPSWRDTDATAVQTVSKAFHSPAWHRYFSRPQGDFLLYREQNIECIVQGQWVSGQIDRMVVYYEQGRQSPASSVHIMDFKTDAHLGEAEGKAHYRAQMQAYRSMVAQAFALDPACVKVSLLHCPALGEAEAWDYGEEDWLSPI